MAASNENRVLLFDFLRVVAIVMILFSHVSLTLGPPYDRFNQFFVGLTNLFYWTTWGEIGVTLFLIISGLSLEYGYGGKKINFASFYKKRIIRIYPIYYMSLLLGLGILVVFGMWGHLRYSEPFIILPNFGFGDLLLSLSGFNAFAGKWGGSIVWASWFIGLVMVLYLLYPVISYAVNKSPWTTIFALLVVSLASRYLVEQSTILSGNPKEWFPLNRIFEFGLGVFLINILGKQFFTSLNRVLRYFPGLVPLSALSFPIFLIHDPLRRFIVLGSDPLTSLTIGIPLFLTLSIVLSKLAFATDEKMQRILKSKFLV
jgi:peptidoglycan/LPS O-acetylase OafA/YrhL